MTSLDPQSLLLGMFEEAISAVQPARCVPSHLPPPPRGRLLVIGAGKASAAMAKAVEDHSPAQLEGIVVTRYGYAVACRRIEILEAAHPVPDAAGLRAARMILDLVQGLNANDTVLCLISGGGSALLPLPLDGLTLGLALDCSPGIHAIACDTDGIDGMEEIERALGRFPPVDSITCILACQVALPACLPVCQFLSAFLQPSTVAVVESAFDGKTNKAPRENRCSMCRRTCPTELQYLQPVSTSA